MKILMVCAEYAPLAKTGGLGDAVAGLSRALGDGGHDVRVLLPGYGDLAKAHPVVAATTDRESGHRFVEIRAASPVRVYLLDAPELFGPAGIYAGDERDAARFIALADGAAHFSAALSWDADVVHCHDWHAALVPVLIGSRREPAPSVRRAKTLLTLHNIGYQGVFTEDVIDGQRHPQLAALIDASDPEPSINFLRSGVQSADLLTTVSPTYAREIQTEAYGMGLEDALRARSADLVGILNGVDYAVWDPRVDPFIGAHYGRDDPEPKGEAKRALCAQLGLTPNRASPVIGLVTRLVPQKGIDLLAAALPGLLRDTRAAFAMLGSGDPVLERALAGFAAQAPARVSFTAGYDEALAHRIFAGSDLVLVPSRYEPCGLTQLYALRYGCIPVVRATGGLADTIQHFDPASGRGNGCVFEHADAQGLTWGIGQALAWLEDDACRRRLIDNAMAADFSWRRQVGQYVAAYERLLATPA